MPPLRGHIWPRPDGLIVNPYAKLTDRQKKRVESFLQEIEVHGAESPTLSHLSFQLHDEARPGRGHDALVTYADSDVVAQMFMDVYGNGGGGAFGHVTWDCYEEEQCEVCVPPCPECGVGMDEILADDGWQKVCCEPGCPESIENP